ncbi:MAG: hypothetical protein QG657_3215 [Acidobacteriota bacterium]|nr:hypothetical protein [Acidobacteriota bacterium]
MEVFLLIPQKGMQKKQGFETLPTKKENPGPCKEGWGAAPFCKKCISR